MEKCSRPSQTTLIFAAVDALVENISLEDFIADRNVTVMSYPCVFDLTSCFPESSASSLRPWIPNSQLTFHDKF